MHRSATPRQVRLILLISIVYLAVAAVFIGVRKNMEFLIYLAVMSVIIVAVLAVYRRAGLSATLLAGFSFWGLLHMIGGLVPIPPHWHSTDTSPVVYNWRLIPGYLRYDQVVHAFGVGLTTWLVWQALSSRVRGDDGGPLRPTPGMLAVCATAGMGFGALNEVVEFIATLILPSTNVGDHVNTGWDLVSNFVGATITGVIVYLVGNRRHRRASSPGYG
ncbi:MAG: DUF2238 domain-containing protein [Verrucomicrobiae bacterium]|nr:DUF2238 domain-containing protein [Verrucomicrobiae bacterium]MCB1087969.1 DUF2238 domain-containing protein [Verrucomicrobiae bacterium]MCB1090820.1 DUF2238 domain-containing protein [Verrucomicrobiae bacterium]